MQSPFAIAEQRPFEIVLAYWRETLDIEETADLLLPEYVEAA